MRAEQNKQKQKIGRIRSNATTVSTRRSEKTPPTGVPTCTRTVHFMLVRLFYAYQRTSGSISCLSLWKKIKIDLSRNDPFFESGLSGLIFLSRQKNKRSLLDLPVLFVVFPLPSKMPKSCSAGNSPKSGKRTCGGSGKWSVPKTLFMICVFYAQTVWPSTLPHTNGLACNFYAQTVWPPTKLATQRVGEEFEATPQHPKKATPAPPDHGRQDIHILAVIKS